MREKSLSSYKVIYMPTFFFATLPSASLAHKHKKSYLFFYF